MAVRHTPRKQLVSQHDVPPEPGTIKDLRELRDRIDVGRRMAEILEGRLVVSPMSVFWHEKACRWLDDQFRDVCREKGWFVDRGPEIELPPTRDLIEPDLLILPDADSVPDLETTRPLDHVILVAEVVSASSIRTDREVKPRSCALGGVPFYLLVDRFMDPLSVTLCSDPSDQGYAKLITAAVGEKLHIPDPFGITLDISTLRLPR